MLPTCNKRIRNHVLINSNDRRDIFRQIEKFLGLRSEKRSQHLSHDELFSVSEGKINVRRIAERQIPPNWIRIRIARTRRKRRNKVATSPLLTTHVSVRTRYERRANRSSNISIFAVSLTDKQRLEHDKGFRGRRWSAKNRASTPVFDTFGARTRNAVLSSERLFDSDETA